MSRRCDREGVPWPRDPFANDVWTWWASHDSLQRRARHRAMVSQPDTDHCAHLCTHADVMTHLRERPVLP